MVPLVSKKLKTITRKKGAHLNQSSNLSYKVSNTHAKTDSMVMLPWGNFLASVILPRVVNYSHKEVIRLATRSSSAFAYLWPALLLEFTVMLAKSEPLFLSYTLLILPPYLSRHLSLFLSLSLEQHSLSLLSLSLSFSLSLPLSLSLSLSLERDFNETSLLSLISAHSNEWN